MNILGLIPARGGSKGIPNKNITLLAGRPLLDYTCAAALASTHLTRVILSTDDVRIAEIGQASGIDVPFMRPVELAQDDTPSILVAKHALSWLAEREGWQADILVLLQPTSPLRQAHHIDEAVSKLLATGADTVVSVIEVPHHFHPYKIMQLEANTLRYFWQESLSLNRYLRQNLPTLYARNGPAVLAGQAAVILNTNSFYGDHIVPYVMQEEDSIDIDTPFDLQLAEWLLSRRAV
jgi:CMP-N,N'-diacetyllegionaminic acid synthase